MKKTAWMIIAVIISLLLIANPAIAAGRGNGKFSRGGKATAVGVPAAEKAVKNDQEKQERTLQFKFKLQKQEKTVVRREFRDIETHWAKNCIEKVQSLGWISGYPDMTFRPDAPVTGIEVVAMVVSMAEDLDNADGEDAAVVDGEEQTAVSEDEAAGDTSGVSEGVNEDEEELMPSDVPAWAKGTMKKAIALKIVNVNRFHSQVQATRAQTAVMLAKALGLQPVDTSSIVFSDQVLISSEDLGYILALAEAGIIKGTPDGRFNPNSAITRAEIAAMLAQIADKAEGDESGTGAPEEQAERQPAPDQTTQTAPESAEQSISQPSDQVTSEAVEAA